MFPELIKYFSQSLGTINITYSKEKGRCKPPELNKGLVILLDLQSSIRLNIYCYIEFGCKF